MDDLISIIVPIYNVKDYLDRCIESIINQTYNKLEIILVNDGSTDGCKEICEKYKKNDDRIIIINKLNGGLSSARNAALDIMKGKYICFIDSDDWVDSEYVETLYKNITKYNTKICSYGKEKINNNIISKDRALYLYLKYNKYYNEAVWHHIFDASLFEKKRFLEGKIHEDTYISYQLLEMVDKISYITYSGYHVIKRNDSITRSKFGDKNYDSVDACRQIYEYYKNSKFEKLAYQKYIGSLLWFIFNTNSIKCDKNIVATNEFKKIINKNGMKGLKLKFIPFVLINKINLLDK